MTLKSPCNYDYSSSPSEPEFRLPFKYQDSDFCLSNSGLLIRNFLLILALLFCCAYASAATLPKAEPVPGGIAVIPIEGGSNETPRAYFNGDRVMVLKIQQQWQAVVGIPLATTPGTYSLRVEDGDKRTTQFDFTVQDKQYATQELIMEPYQLMVLTRAV